MVSARRPATSTLLLYGPDVIAWSSETCDAVRLQYANLLNCFEDLVMQTVSLKFATAIY